MTDEMKETAEKARLYREAYEQGRFDLKMDVLQALTKLLDNGCEGISAEDILLTFAHVH